MSSSGNGKAAPGKSGAGASRSYNTMNLALRNRNESTELRRLLRQLEREETYVRKSINIDIRVTRGRYKRFMPLSEEETQAQNTELLFRSIRQPCMRQHPLRIKSFLPDPKCKDDASKGSKQNDNDDDGIVDVVTVANDPSSRTGSKDAASHLHVPGHGGFSRSRLSSQATIVSAPEDTTTRASSSYLLPRSSSSHRNIRPPQSAPAKRKDHRGGGGRITSAASNAALTLPVATIASSSSSSQSGRAHRGLISSGIGKSHIGNKPPPKHVKQAW